MSDFEKKFAIREVLDGYSGAASRLDIQAFLSFFTSDAEIHGVAKMFGRTDPLKGHAQIGEFFGPSLQNLEWLVQQNTTTDVKLLSGGSRAETRTGVLEMAKRKNASMIVLIARYDDELTLTAAGWRFTKRTLTPFRFSEVP